MSPRVLLITPQFFGVEKEIISVLEETGYDVKWIENKTLLFDYHGIKSKCKLIRRFYFWLFTPQKRYLKSEFRKIGDYKFDILFAINAHVINSQLFRVLKKANPDLVSFLYLWDSSGMYNWEKEIKCFDKIFTFDPTDALKYNIVYKPNFFLKNVAAPRNDYDLFFVGKFNRDRKLLIDKIIEQSQQKKIKLFVKLFPAYKIFPHNLFLYNLFKILNIKQDWIIKYMTNYEAVEGLTESDYMINKPLSYNDIQDRLLRSNVILDIPFEHQTGYTHRVIEALANGKKVLTTNRIILTEDFYNPDQIHILDPGSPEIEMNWIKEKTIFHKDNCFHNLELSIWLKSIFDGSDIKS